MAGLNPIAMSALFGYMAAHSGKLTIAGETYITSPFPVDTLVGLHMLSGKLLLGYSFILLGLKVYLLSFNWKRTKATVPNPLVRFSISQHYSFVMALIIMQYVSMNYAWIFMDHLPSWVRKQGVTANMVHLLGGIMLAGVTFMLSLEKLYLVMYVVLCFRPRNAPAKSDTKKAAEKKKAE